VIATQKRKNKSFADGVLEVKASGCTLYDEVHTCRAV
jgi:hypothetical protein